MVQNARKTIPKRRGDFITKLLIVLGGNGKLAGEHGAADGTQIRIDTYELMKKIRIGWFLSSLSASRLNLRETR